MSGGLGFFWRGPVDKTIRLCDEHLPGKWEWFFTGITLFNVGFGFMWRRRVIPSNQDTDPQRANNERER